MTDKKRKPLVLVVDDEPDWQSKIRRMLEELMDAEVEVAGSIQEACQMGLDHEPEGESPVDLAIVDMRMPLAPGRVELDEAGGISVLRQYRLIACPLIVFTRWPSYGNCLEAAQAGAVAYISKISGEGESRGFEELMEWCERILVKTQSLYPPAPPTEEWLARNSKWLSQNFPGRWVAFAKADRVTEPPEGAQEREGVLVVGAESYEALRKVIVACPEILGQSPAIVFNPETAPQQ